MAAPGYYYFFIGPAVAAFFMLLINAFTIVFSSSAKPFLVTGRMTRKELQRRIPARRYQGDEAKGEEECSVCLSAFSDEQQVRRLLHCGHEFHVCCIDKWLMLHASCPICRGDAISSVRDKRVGCCGV